MGAQGKKVLGEAGWGVYEWEGKGKGKVGKVGARRQGKVNICLGKKVGRNPLPGRREGIKGQGKEGR